MREEVASLVLPVLEYGLRVKERLEHGEKPDLQSEQAKLKGLLLSEAEARRLTDYGGEAADGDSSYDLRADDGARGKDRFLGIRYALVCWLDEFFILHTPWESRWNERKLEVELYGTNDRAWKFWRQAELALARPQNDALEAFFLCVQLGFRGELREEGDKLQAWVSATKSRVAKIRNQEWPYPVEYQPPTYVPPHYGRGQLQHMILTGGMLLLLLIPVVVFFMVKRLAE